MTDDMNREQAVRALDEIRARQHQVVTATVIPDWFWAAIGTLIVVFTAAIESQRPLYIGLGTTVYVIGLLTVIWRVVARARAGIRPTYLGRPGFTLIAGFTGALVALGLAIGFGLAALGFRWPATAADVVVAIALTVGGPWLMRRLRRLMAQRADAVLGA